MPYLIRIIKCFFILRFHKYLRGRRDAPRLLINRDPTGDFGNYNSNNRDVFYQSSCDEGCEKLAELLGWKVSCIR